MHNTSRQERRKVFICVVIVGTFSLGRYLRIHLQTFAKEKGSRQLCVGEEDADETGDGLTGEKKTKKWRALIVWMPQGGSSAGVGCYVILAFISMTSVFDECDVSNLPPHNYSTP
jgi:hypothetical protein